jgi:surface polysaccharide O-acyltransferase-like enzyme
MLLNKVLQKENNNLDVFRVIAAVMVIYGHANAFLPGEGRGDIVARFLPFDYSGSLAVKLFFFLSGLVVTNSLIEKKGCLPVCCLQVFSVVASINCGFGSVGICYRANCLD